MRRYLKQLKPTQIEDIIAMVALYRPGPMAHIPQYINAKNGITDVKYLHEKLEPIFKNHLWYTGLSRTNHEDSSRFGDFPWVKKMMAKAIGKNRKVF